MINISNYYGVNIEGEVKERLERGDIFWRWCFLRYEKETSIYEVLATNEAMDEDIRKKRISVDKYLLKGCRFIGEVSDWITCKIIEEEVDKDIFSFKVFLFNGKVYNIDKNIFMLAPQSEIEVISFLERSGANTRDDEVIDEE